MTKIYRITEDKMHYTTFRKENKNKKCISISMCRLFKVTLTKFEKKKYYKLDVFITYHKKHLCFYRRNIKFSVIKSKPSHLLCNY